MINLQSPVKFFSASLQKLNVTRSIDGVTEVCIFPLCQIELLIILLCDRTTGSSIEVRLTVRRAPATSIHAQLLSLDDEILHSSTDLRRQTKCKLMISSFLFHLLLKSFIPSIGILVVSEAHQPDSCLFPHAPIFSLPPPLLFSFSPFPASVSFPPPSLTVSISPLLASFSPSPFPPEASSTSPVPQLFFPC